MTLAMKPGAMDSYAMFTQLEVQRQLRVPRLPLGYTDHYTLVPLLLVLLFSAILWA